MSFILDYHKSNIDMWHVVRRAQALGSLSLKDSILPGPYFRVSIPLQSIKTNIIKLDLINLNGSIWVVAYLQKW